MDYRQTFIKSSAYVATGVLVIGLLWWAAFIKTSVSASADAPITPQGGQVAKNQENNSVVASSVNQNQIPAINTVEDAAIQEQLDRDRRQQRKTKELKNKLEQTNLELEQEKALAEINKLKKENQGAFSEPSSDGQTSLPEIKVNYIGGNDVKKEAIISIGNISYQVKEKSSPVDNIQVVTIGNSSITVHFGAPINTDKTIEYKPE